MIACLLQDLHRKIESGIHMLGRLRATHRQIAHAVEASKDASSSAKQRLDAHHLNLQSLEYEKQHLLAEIQRCRDYMFVSDELDLAEPDGGAVHGDAHAHMLARLAHEKTERERLVLQLRELDAARAAIEQRVRATRYALDSLRTQLGVQLHALQPLLSFTATPITLTPEEKALAMLLPAPLYVALVQLRGCIDAAAWHDDVRLSLALPAADVPDGLLVADAANIASLVDSITRRRSEAPGGELLDDDDEGRPLHAASLLRLVLRVCPASLEASAALPIEIVFLPRLGVLAVRVPLARLAASDAALGCLWPGDSGLASPNPANLFMDGYSAAQLFYAAHGRCVLRAYDWLQCFGGLSFLPLQRSELVEAASHGGAAAVSASSGSAAAAAKRVRTALGRVLRRLAARAALERQVATLRDARALPVAGVSAAFPLAPRARLVAFESCDVQEFRDAHAGSSAAARPLGASASLAASTDDEAAAPGAQAFRLRLAREAGALEAVVLVAADYPVRPPVFRICATPDGGGAALSPNVAAAIETEVNLRLSDLGCPAADGAMLLSYQVRKLVFCFDVAGELAVSGDDSLVASRLALRPVYGRNREMPLAYDPALRLLGQHAQP